jgi:hypothetical protein
VAPLDLQVTLDSEQLELIVQRAAEILAEQQQSATVDGWIRGAVKIAAYVDAPASRVYALSAAGRMPVERDGSNLIARRSELDAWVRAGGAKRP